MKDTDLIEFEQEIADAFNSGKVPYPIHLENGNENTLIELFKDIKSPDWVCGTWRMHFKCLLKGVPKQELKKAICRGESISLCFPEYRVISSAIVGGIVSIAVGIALGIKLSGGSEHVWCFLGDMSARTGDFMCSRNYALSHDLPITWIIENNGKSVVTDTESAWNSKSEWGGDDIISYDYDLKWPHAGTGKRIQF